MKRVAIQGISGSYSEEAVREIFGSAATIVECTDFDATFAAINDGTADHAVVPVENKIVGSIAPAVSLLRTSRYRVLDQLPLKVQHVLAGIEGARFEDLRSVRSHIEALKQCSTFLSANPQLTQVVGADTASSVRRIAETDDRSMAAICSRRAAELYGAEVFLENIANDNDNWTVFYLIGN